MPLFRSIIIYNLIYSGGYNGFFFEEEAFTKEGELKQAKELSINKIGHGNINNNIFVWVSLYIYIYIYLIVIVPLPLQLLLLLYSAT